MNCFWRKYMMLELKKSTDGLFLIALKIDVKFEGKITCTS